MSYLDKERIYETLVENMNEAVWVGDKNLNTVYVNSRGYELTGYKKEEVIGKSGENFWERGSAEKIMRSKTPSGKNSRYIGNLLSKSGEKIPAMLNATKLKDGSVIAIITDLREMIEKESIYRQLIEHMNEGVFMTDKKGKIIYANQKFCEILKMSLEDIIDKKACSIWDKVSSKEVCKIEKEKREKDLNFSYEGNMVDKSGSKVPVLFFGTPVYDGKMIAIVNDLRKSREQEERQKILNRAVQHANDAIIIISIHGRIKSWNKGAKIIFGYKDDEVVNKSINKILSKDEFEDLSSHTKRAKKYELNAKNKIGENVKLALTLTPVYKDKSSVVMAYLIVARDITAEAKYEEERILKYQKIHEAYEKFGMIRRQMDYIVELLNLCSESKDMKSVADFVVNSAIMLTKVDACVLRVMNEKHTHLKLVSSFGVGAAWNTKSTVIYKDSLAEKAYKKDMPLKIIDISKEGKYQSLSLARKQNLYSMMLIPLMFKRKLIGTLSLYTGPDKKLEIFENEFIEKYAHAVEVAIGSMM